MRSMDRRRRPEPAAIDITWVSCRGVRSSVPFHTPCLYASIYVTAAATSRGAHGRRPHRVKTATDRAGGANPEWDAPLRLYLPEAAAPDGGAGGGGGGAFHLRFELKSVVAVLGDVLAASAVVPVADLVADGRTRRLSYQLAASDGRQHNGVISFSYAFRDSTKNDAGEDDESAVKIVGTPRCLQPSPRPTTESRMYPVIEWTLTQHAAVYPPPATSDMAVTPSRSYHYPPPPTPATLVEPVAVSPACRGLYPKVEEPATAGGMYPTVDLAPVSCCPPAEPCYGGGCGYAAAPAWDGRCLYS